MLVYLLLTCGVLFLLALEGQANLSLLGIKNKRSNGNPNDHGSASEEAATFAIDTSKEVSRIYGKGLRFQLDSLEVAGLDGLLKLTNSNLQFEKGNFVWKTAMEESTMSTYHNNRKVIDLDLSDEFVEESKLKFVGDATFRDLWISDTEKARDILVNLCKTDRILHPLPVGVTDKVANAHSVEQCDSDMASTQLSVGSMEDYVSKLLVAGARLQMDTAASLAQLRDITTNLGSAEDKGAAVERSAVEERERVRVIMTEFEAVVDALRSELAGRVKGLGGAVEALRSEWTAANTRLADVEASVSGVVSQSVAPLEESVRALSLNLDARSLQLNSTVSDAVHSLRNNYSAQYALLNNSLGTVAGEVSGMYAAVVANFSGSALAISAVAAEQAALQHALESQFNTSTKELHTVIESSVALLSEDFRSSVNRTVALQQEVALLAAQTQQHNGSIATLHGAFSLQNTSINNLAQRVVDASRDLQSRLNSSAAALHAEVTAQIEGNERERLQAHAGLLSADAVLGDRISTVAASTENMIAGNVSSLSNATSALVEERVLSLRHQILQNAEMNAVQWTSTNASVTSLAAQLTANLDNATNTHWAATTAAIAELTANTSHVVARSNSILARAIGEVNSSVLLLAESVLEQMSGVRTEALMNTTSAVAALRDSVHQRVQGLSDATNSSLEQLRLEYGYDLRNQSDTLSSRLAALDERVLRGAEAAAVQTAIDQADARKQVKSVNSTLLAHVDALQAELVAQQASLNHSLSSSLGSLESRLSTVDAEIKALVNGTVTSLNSSFYVAMLEQRQHLITNLAEMRDSTESAFNATADKLRYQLVALTASLDKTRAEDGAAMETALSAMRETDAALEKALRSNVLAASTELTAAKDALSSAILAVGVNATTRAGELEALFTEKLRNHSTAHEDKLVSARIQFNDTVKVLEASIDAAVAAQVTSHSAFEVEVQAVRAHTTNLSLSVQTAAHDELQQAMMQMKEHSAAQAALVAAASNSSLHTAVATLASSHHASLASLAAQATANHSSVTASVDTLNKTLRGVELAGRDNIAAVANAAHHNISLLGADFTRQSAELMRAISNVNTSFSAALVRSQENHAVVTAQVEAKIATTVLSLRDANTSVHKRIDAADAALAEASRAASLQATTQALALERHANLSSVAVSTQWTRTAGLVATVSERAAHNISQLSVALTRAIQDGDLVLQQSLNSQQRDLSARLDSAETAATSAQQLIRTELAAALSAANITATAALAGLSTKHEALVSDVKSESKQRDLLQSHTDASMQSLTSGLERLNAGLLSQSTAVNSTLLEFKTAQTAEHIALLARVEERVRAAEVQQQLGAVAVQAASNATRGLSLDVGRMSSAVSAMEVQVATLHTKADILQKRNDAFGDYYANFTSTILPQVHSQLGAAQQQTEHLESSLRSVEAALTAATKDAVSAVQELRVTLVSSDSRTHQLAADLVLVDERTSGAMASLHGHFLDVAVGTNVTSVHLAQLEKVVAGMGEDVRSLNSRQVDLSDAQRRVRVLEESFAEAVESVRALEKSSASSVQALREVVDVQAQQLLSLSATAARQQEEVTYLQGENRRLLRETASTASVDELRKLLFEMQNQMLAHSSKVLDVLLQPRSAVLVHAPSPAADPVEPGAENV